MNDRLPITLLVAVCLLLFFSRLGMRPLWNQNAGMHAATSKVMVQSGDWVTPTHHGKPSYDKPAFHNWLVALAFLGVGFTELGARLPNAVMGTATVIVTYFLGKWMYGRRTGLLAGVVLATSLGFLAMSRTVLHDMSLTFFVTAALALFYLGYSRETHRRRRLLLSAACLGFAVLAKGPLGLLVPGAIVVVFLATRRDLGFVGRIPFVSGALVFLLVAAPWYIAIGRRNPEYWAYFLELNVESFASEASHYPRPIYYHIGPLIVGFAPWSLFLLPAFYRGFRRRTVEQHGGTLLLIVWAAFWLSFFSIARSKLPSYILPMVPPLALVVAAMWSELRESPGIGLLRAVRCSYVSIAIVPGALIFLLLREPNRDLLKYGFDLVDLAVPLVLFTVAIGTSWLFLYRGRVTAAFAGLAISTAILFGSLAYSVEPPLTDYRSSKQIALRMDELLPPGEDLIMIGGLRDTALFYTNRRVDLRKRRSDANRLLRSAEPVFLLIGESDFERRKLDAHILLRVGDDLLISNRPGPG